VAVAGNGSAARGLVQEVFTTYLPRRVVAGWPEAGTAAPIALLAGRELVGGQPAAYLCRDFACDLPVTDPAALRTVLESAARAR
jgi:uncharacterized protein YyaL (SSP411 family)